MWQCLMVILQEWFPFGSYYALVPFFPHILVDFSYVPCLIVRVANERIARPILDVELGLCAKKVKSIAGLERGKLSRLALNLSKSHP